ncbi:MAG TPA: DnaJ domain-containing protein [Cytophagaceae bacterium]|jgi:curved DNA-binding protein CbpA|nr:DnaJ domain-containing protein [Cytophagaceae bacterium]
MQHNSYYRILEVSENASDEEIRKAYRSKAKLYHPDVNQSPDAHSTFVLLTVAYNTLINRHKRGGYDQKRQSAADPFRAYSQWTKTQKAQAAYNAQMRYYEFIKHREKLRNNPFKYYQSLIFVYMVTAFGYSFSSFLIVICSIIIFLKHPIWFFFLLPFICAGIFLIRATFIWYKDAKRYF